MRERFSGWRDVEEFIDWEAQDAENQRQALEALARRERPSVYMSKKALFKALAIVGLAALIGTLLVLGGWHWLLGKILGGIGGE